MAQKAKNQGCTHAKFGTGIDTGAVQPVDDHVNAHAVPGMRLGIEKNLGMNHIVCRSTGQISMRHVVKILLGAQRQRAGMVDIQKVLQIVKYVGPAQRVNIRIGHRDSIALPQRKHQLRLQRAFNMHVQFRFGHASQQLRQALGRDGLYFQHGHSLS